MKKKTIKILSLVLAVLLVLPVLCSAAQIAVNGEKTITEAIAEAQNGDTIVLEKDCTENIVVTGNKTIILDLNGHNIAETNGDTITVEIGSTLTIKGTGIISNSTSSKSVLVNNGTTTIENGTIRKNDKTFYNILNHGDLVIKGGTVINEIEYVSGQSHASLIDNGYSNFGASNPRNGHVDGVNKEEPTLTINGGTFDGGLNTIKNDDNGTLVINGGLFKNNIQVALLNWNIATVNGGTFEVPLGTNKTTICNGSFGLDSVDKGILEINGGTFKGEYAVQDNTAYTGSTTIADVNIRGGDFQSTISFAPEDDPLRDNLKISGGKFTTNDFVGMTIIDGYTVYNEDGKYIVDKEAHFTKPTETITMLVGDTANLDLTLTDNSVSKYIGSVLFNDEIAKLENGVITALKAGQTVIISTLNGANEKVTNIVVCEIKVVENEEGSEEQDALIGEEVESIIKDIIEGNEVENLTEEQVGAIREAINSGAVIEAEVKSAEVEEEDIEEDSQKVKELIGEEGKVAVYYNIDVVLTDSNTDTEVTKLTNLSDKITVTIKLPANLPEVKEGYTRTFTVVKVHGGEAEELETIDNGDGTLSFETSEFSTYAATYVDEPKTTEEEPTKEVTTTGTEEKKETKTSNPKTGDVLLVAVSIILVAGVGLVVTKKIRK